MENFSYKVSFIWSVADLLRGDYKQSEYGKVILPLVVLRRLDCVLAPTKEAVLAEHTKHRGKVENVDPILERITGHKGLFNTSKFDLPKLLDDPNHVADNLRAYIAGFSTVPREVMHRFGFDVQIDRLDRSKLLYLVVSRFCDIDLHPDKVSNVEMGYVYEELIRRFSEQSNETAGEHFTPREVIKLMVNLLFLGDEDVLARPGRVLTLADPACGTGGMLSVAEEYVRQHSAGANLRVFGQELNDETYATCRADMILKGQDAANIHPGNSFTDDGLAGQTFDYMLANPPFGVEWKKVADDIRHEHETLGYKGRFGAGLPSIGEGSLLFLQHMLSKMKPVESGGSRTAIVFSGSPLFNGAAGSGPSEIRRWIIENDWLEAVVALPDQLFYNSAIATYFWVLTNRKSPERQGMVQLLDARQFAVKMRKSLGDKRKEISEAQIASITEIYADRGAEGDFSRLTPNEAFGYQRITVERPLRLRWEVAESTIEAVHAAPAIAKLDSEDRHRLVRELQALPSPISRDAVLHAMSKIDLSTKPIVSAVTKALGVRDAAAAVVTDAKGRPVADAQLRDQHNVPLPPRKMRFQADTKQRLASNDYRTTIDEYVAAEVLPFLSDAWVDHARTKLGYEIPLTRYFYKYEAPRPLAEIDAELQDLESRITANLQLGAKTGLAEEVARAAVELVPSPLPWLPRQPAHWPVVLLKLVARLGSGHTPSRSHSEWWIPEECTIPWITTGEVSQMRSDRVEHIVETRERISTIGLANSSAEVHPADTVVLSRTASVGFSAIMGVDMATSQDFATWTCGPSLQPRFLLLCLRAMRQDLLGRLAQGSTHKSIYMPDIESVRIPLPPLDEQQALVDLVQARLSALDEPMELIGRQLSLLEEKRRTLMILALSATQADGD